MRLFEVGGHVRDEILGVKSDDVDYSVEINLNDFKLDDIHEIAGQAYEYMNRELESQGFKIFERRPEFFTTRAMFPKTHKHSGVADFVMCRKEVYTEGSRQPEVEVGTILDDLARRDFTVNAIAKCVETGEILDPYDGKQAIKDKILYCPMNAKTSFSDDPLRILRALRFNLTKGFHMGSNICDAFVEFDASKFSAVSVERTMNELTKMFKFDTKGTLELLSWTRDRNPYLYDEIIKGFWLMPTNKKK